jgi:hypothetical protein
LSLPSGSFPWKSHPILPRMAPSRPLRNNNMLPPPQGKRNQPDIICGPHDVLQSNRRCKQIHKCCGVGTHGRERMA